MVLTTSGDGTAHIWQCAVNMHNESSSGRVASSEDELDPTEREFLDGHDMEDTSQCSVLRTPLKSLQSHSGVVISGDWLPGGDQLLTAGWDRLASIWDADTGTQYWCGLRNWVCHKIKKYEKGPYEINNISV